MTADILAAIDTALAGDATITRQGDAMRWHPGRVICDGGTVLWPERWSVLRHGAYAGLITDGGHVYRLADLPSPEALAAFGRALGVTYAQMAEAARQMARMLAKAFLPLRQQADAWAHEVYHRERPRTWSRCPRCNPAGNPRPLCINGQEYRRRQRARKKRHY